MKSIKRVIPQIVFLLITTLLCMTYITEDVVRFQIVIFATLIGCYLIAPKQKIEKRNMHLYVIMILFSVMYFMRAFFDLEFFGVRQTLFGNNKTVYVFIFIGAIMQFLFIPRLKLEGKSFSWPFFFFSLLILGSLYMSFRSIMSGDVVMTSDGRIQADERLGVIQYGHLGLTAVIMGIVMFMKRGESKFFMAISPLLLMVGLFSIVMAGTRSAMVGLFLISFLVVSTRLQPKTIIVSLGVIAFLLSFSSAILSFTENLGANSAARMLRFLSEGGDQSSGRTDIWIHALNNLMESPIIGVSSFINSSEFGHDFLHNSFVEVAYSLGLVGFLMFLTIHVFALVTSYRIFKLRNLDYMCFAMLYIQYLTYTMFSESIMRLPEYWYLLSMVICIGFHYVPKKKQLSNINS